MFSPGRTCAAVVRRLRVLGVEAQGQEVMPAIGALFQTPLMYATAELSSPTTLRKLLPVGPDDTFISYLLAGLDLMFIWWFINVAIGFAVLYRTPPTPIATTLLALYGGITGLVALVRSI